MVSVTRIGHPTVCAQFIYEYPLESGTTSAVAAQIARFLIAGIDLAAIYWTD